MLGGKTTFASYISDTIGLIQTSKKEYICKLQLWQLLGFTPACPLNLSVRWVDRRSQLLPLQPLTSRAKQNGKYWQLVRKNTRKAAALHRQTVRNGKQKHSFTSPYNSLVEKFPKIQRIIWPSFCSLVINYSCYNYMLLIAGGGKHTSVKNTFRNSTFRPIRRQQGLSKVILSDRQPPKGKNFYYQDLDLKCYLSVW